MVIRDKLKILLWIITIMGMNEGLLLGAQEYNIRQESLVRGIGRGRERGNIPRDHFEVRISAEVNDDNVRIRTIPSVSEGVIIGTLQGRTQIVVLGKSSFLEKIGRKKYRWLQVEWEKQKGWIYGEYIDLETRDIQALPVMRMYESPRGKEIEVFRKKERALTVTDLDAIIKKYDKSLIEDDEIIGSAYVLSSEGFVRTYDMPYGGGISDHSSTPTFWIIPLRYKGHIVLLLFEKTFYSTKATLLDYKVIPDLLNSYQTVDDIDDYGSFIMINGKSRMAHFPTIVLVLGNRPIEYDEIRNDVIDAYVVDIGTKKYVTIQDKTRLSFQKIRFTD